MKQSLQLRIGQQLAMTPQLQQAIRLLQLSTLDLRTEIQQALDSNPMLEQLDEQGDSGQEDWDPGEADTVGEAGSESAAEGPGEDADLELDNGSRTDNIPDDLPVDSSWEDTYDSFVPTTAASGEGEAFDFDSRNTSSESLYDHLVWQMQLTPFSDRDLEIAATIIDAVDDDGYLSVSLDDIRDAVNNTFEDDEAGVEADEIEAVLHRIQNFDPVGVAARDLRECLLLQLHQLAADSVSMKLAGQIVTDHFEQLANRDYSALLRALKCSQEQLEEAIRLIQSLNPRPGNVIAARGGEYIIPDVVVRKAEGRWRVELNSESLPRLRINKGYAGLVKRADNSADNVYLKNHLQEARWFLKSLQSRNETLLKVATCIVEQQRDFLEHGEEAMKAMVLHDVADAIGMHESTVSRVTTQKYMHTPRGLYELKYFFSSHVGTAGGGECSATAIRALLKKMVAEENARKPLSDNKLAQMLKEQGINVARRTIAKYRESIGIPSSSERKRLI